MDIREFLKEAAVEIGCDIRRAIGVPDDAPDDIILQTIKGVGADAATTLHQLLGMCDLISGMCMGGVIVDGEILDQEGAPFERMRDLIRDGLGIIDR